MDVRDAPQTLEYTDLPPAETPRWMRRVGWVLTVLLGLLFVAMPAGLGLFALDMAKKGTVEQGYPESSVVPILLVEAACGLLFAIPRTAMLGAILLVGYLGGAVATHVRAGDGMWPAPIVIGLVVGLAIWLRDARVRALVPIRWRPER